MRISLVFVVVQSLSHAWLWPHGLQHTRLPCPSPSPGACSNSCTLSQCGYLTSLLPCLQSSLWFIQPSISHDVLCIEGMISVVPFSFCLQSFPAWGSFPLCQLFTTGGQTIEASASASVLPMNIQDWFPLGLTSCISLQSKGLSEVFSNTTVQKHQLLGAQPSLWSNSIIHTLLVEKPQLWLYGLYWQSNIFAF